MKTPAVKVLFAAVAAVVLALTPLVGQCVTIDVTKFQQRYPWNGLVDIDYTITRDQGESELDPAKHSVRISVVNCAEALAVTNIAHVFRQGIVPVSDGAHRVTWDANAEGVNFKSQDVKVFAEIVHYAEKYMVIDVSEGPDATEYHVTYYNGAPEGGFANDTYRGDKIALRLIPPGSFVMGSPTAEPGRTAASEVQHAVAITKPFYIGVFQITQKQYQNVMNANPSQYTDTDGYRPVEKVTYNKIRGTAEPSNNHKYDWPHNSDVDMQNSFMGKLRAKCKEQNLSGEWELVSGLFDLPTEAQWEYACRAGTTTPFNNGEPCVDVAALHTQLKKLGRYSGDKNDDKGCSDAHTVVGRYTPNDWGLYDMHGNVWEWCLDWYQGDVQNIGNPSVNPVGPAAGSDRVRCGGSFYDDASASRSASRLNAMPTAAVINTGFRLSRTLP